MKTKQSKLVALTTVIVICLIASSSAYSKAKHIYMKSDTDRSGYYEIIERHDIESNGDEHHTLLCNDPGMSECKWESNPCGKLINYAKDQIALGVLTGQHQVQENLNTYTVTWGYTEGGEPFIEEIQNLNDPLN